MSTGVLKQSRIWLHRKLIRYGIDVRKRREDRKILEQVIFPVIQQESTWQRILFVGCAWYTMHYPAKFADRSFITMEICPQESRYGAEQHIIDSCENIDEYFAQNSLDVVILNGVYGFGLNEWAPIERTFRGIHTALTPGGLFVLGWNDLPGHNPYPMRALESIVPFEPYLFPTLNTQIYESDSKNRHRFHFYRKATH
jgi:SAM-dependent methyltransferase